MAEWILPLYARPSDNVAPASTVTTTAGTINTTYPAQNLVDLDPAKPSKFTGTSGTYRFTWSGTQVISAIVIVNHTGGTYTLTNGAGVNQAIAIPAHDGGQSVAAWFDLTALWTVGQRTDDVWDLAISGASPVAAVGEVLFLTPVHLTAVGGLAALRELDWIWGVTFVPEWAAIQHRTFGRSKIQYDKRIRLYRIRGQVNLDADADDLRALHTDARGPINGFVIIPDEATNEAHFMAFTPNGFSWSPTNPGITEMPMELETVSSGPPLFP